MTKETITLDLAGKKMEVGADVVGDLALHAAVRKDQTGLLSMTHVPTAMSFNSAVPDEVSRGWKKSRRKVLLDWMRRVQEGMPKDWLALRKLTAENVRNNPDYSRVLRDRVRAHCLKTMEVE